MTLDDPREVRASESMRSGRRAMAWIMLVTGVAILLFTAWVGWRTYDAYRHLQAAATQVASLQQELSDPAQLPAALQRQQAVAALQANADAARSSVDDPLYRLAIGVPLVGPNLDAIRRVSHTVDGLSTDVLGAFDGIVAHLDPRALAPKDGAVDLDPLIAVAPQLQRADAAVQDAQAELLQIDHSSVVAPIAEAVSAMQVKLDAVAALTGPAARTARLLPEALGADGPRTYLVLFQNLAEPRATGGIFGSYAVLTAEHGRLTIADQGPGRELRYFDPPAGEISEQQRRLFGPELATFPADVNLTPDFPTAARLFAAMYQARGGGQVDGVMAIDPVALSYLLQGSAPLNVDGVSIDAGNVVSTLLSTAYQRFGDDDHDPRDQFLAKATSAAFAHITGGTVDPADLIAGVRKAAVQRRLLYYSFHAEEQRDLSSTGLSGAIDGPAEAHSIGIFLNDAVASKLGYYLVPGFAVTGGECQADGSQLATVTVDLAYQPPAGRIPEYVTGRSSDGGYRVQVQLALPAGGRIADAEINGRAASVNAGTDLGRPFGIAVVDLPAGSHTTATFHIVVPPADRPPDLIHTPTVADWPVTVDGVGSCTR